MRPIVLGMLSGLALTPSEQISLIRRTGFDGVFTDWSDEEGLSPYLADIRREGLCYQSVHAPFDRIQLLWGRVKRDALSETARLLRCLEDAARAEVPIVVLHTIKGMRRHTPNERGLPYFGHILDRARELGIRVALENTEGECYLSYLFDAFRNHPAIGFCIDTGHEMCYNERRDLITKYGDYLIATHLNDNFGRTGGGITWHDDAHLLPFDGSADWRGIVRRLRAVGYGGPLTLELTRMSKPGRTTHDIYEHLSDEAFFRLIHERAVLLAEMMDDNT